MKKTCTLLWDQWRKKIVAALDVTNCQWDADWKEMHSKSAREFQQFLCTRAGKKPLMLLPCFPWSSSALGRMTRWIQMSLMETLESLLWSLVGAQCAFGMWFSSHLGCEALHKGKLSTTGGSADSQLLHLQELMVIYFNHINCQFLPHFSLSPWRYNLFAFPVIKSIFHLIVSHSLIAIFC